MKSLRIYISLKELKIVMPMNRYSVIGVTTVFALLVAGTVIPNAYAVIAPIDSEFAYESPDEFWEKLESTLPEVLEEAGFEEEIMLIMNAIREGEDNEEYKEIISEYRYFMYSVSKGSLYAFGCLLPQSPPLLLGQNIQCGVLFGSMNKPITVNDLHVNINKPSGTVNLLNIPSNFPPTDPFLWISTPITLDEIGTWNIVTDFTYNGQVVLTLDVAFNVIPESIIGVAGIIAGPLAALACKLRKRSQ